MLFYTALIVAGVIAAAVVVWVAKSMMVAGKSAYRTMSPANGGDQARLAHLNSNLAAAPAPWGWGGQNSGAPASSKPASSQLDRYRAPSTEPVSRSKSKDWSELEAYERSYKKAAQDRDTSSPTSGSVRNLLAGYDMNRETSTDTSSWPYQNGFKPGLSGGASVAKDSGEPETSHEEQPTKPWGW